MTQALNVESRFTEDDDPYQAIIDAQVQVYADELETMQQNGSEAESEPDSDTSSEPSTSKGKREAAEGKRPGIDKVLREVDTKLGRNAGDVIRSVLTKYQEGQTSLKSVQERMDALEAALTQPDEPAPQEPEDPRLANLTPEQLALAEAMMRKLGYVKQDDLKQAETQKNQAGYVSTEVGQGLKDWGEEFGYLDDEGQFVFSSEVLADINQVHDRIYDPTRGLTSRDLYILARWDQLAKGAASKATTMGAQQLARQQKLSALQRGVTERRSTPGRARAEVRRSGDSLEDVVARSFAAALRENNAR